MQKAITVHTKVEYNKETQMHSIKQINTDELNNYLNEGWRVIQMCPFSGTGDSYARCSHLMVIIEKDCEKHGA